MTRICKIKDCGKLRHNKDWCSLHYTRWKRQGNPLTVKRVRTPTALANKFFNDAMTSNTDKCIVWPYATNGTGYGTLKRNNKHGLAHRIMLIETFGNPPTLKHHAAHKPIVCHNTLCVNPRHLRWATASENMADRILDGTDQRGHKSHRAKLTECQVRAIRVDKRSQRKIAEDYPVTRSAIKSIKEGRSWAHLK